MSLPLEMTLPNNRTYSTYVGIFLAPTGVTEKQEVLVFDALELIGNVGGYLGLLLGWSAMSLVDWYFKRTCQK